MDDKKYTDINSGVIDSWVEAGWEWGTPVSGETLERARRGDWSVLLTPVKPVPRGWFPEMKGKSVLGLACGGGQQMPVFAALGAVCTVMDYSGRQLESEALVARREGYDINIVKADMSEPFPFDDGSFDMIFHPVSNCYVEDVCHIWRECRRVLRRGGLLLAGLDNGLNYAYDEAETELTNRLPYNPLKDAELYAEAIKNGDGIQFSHTIEEQIGGQLAAGFALSDIYQDTNGSGRLHTFNVPTFYATLATAL